MMSDMIDVDQGPSASTSSVSIQRMFTKVIAAPDAFFRSQQKNEPDLCEDEKYAICSRLYSDHPVQFLSRYHKFLDSEDVECFKELQESVVDDTARYECHYYLMEMGKKQLPNEPRLHEATVKNRRYAAMKRMISNGQYFSDCAMRERDPLLYDQMVGRYQTESEQRQAFHSGDRDEPKLSSALLDMYDAVERSKREQVQLAEQTTDNLQHQLTMDSEHDDIGDDYDTCNELESAEELAVSSVTAGKIPASEKQALREDFIREMQERFLDGDDANFDYKTVDDNSEYDPVDLQARDAEDRYFDEEEPQNCLSQDGDILRSLDKF